MLCTSSAVIITRTAVTNLRNYVLTEALWFARTLCTDTLLLVSAALLRTSAIYLLHFLMCSRIFSGFQHSTSVVTHQSDPNNIFCNQSFLWNCLILPYDIDVSHSVSCTQSEYNYRQKNQAMLLVSKITSNFC